MNIFPLNQKQIKQLAEIANKFPEVDWFTLEVDNSNGIGPVVKVKFTLFDKEDGVSVDITDVDTW